MSFVEVEKTINIFHDDRDETWRLGRLHRFIGAFSALGGNIDSVISIKDHEGLLTIVWENSQPRVQYEKADNAWCIAGEPTALTDNYLKNGNHLCGDDCGDNENVDPVDIYTFYSVKSHKKTG